jgi:hypothetical protein
MLGTLSRLFNPQTWPVLRQLLAICAAVGLIVLAFALGFPNVGGVLILSTLYVVVWTLLKSGALSTSWLQRLSPSSLKNASRIEFAKAMICAGIGVDGLAAMLIVWRYRMIGQNEDLRDIILLTWLLLWIAGIGLFLVRSYAAYLLARRQ